MLMFTPIQAGRWSSKRSFHVEAFIMWLIRVVSHYWVSAGSLSQRVLRIHSWSQCWWPKEQLSLLTCRVHSAWKTERSDLEMSSDYWCTYNTLHNIPSTLFFPVDMMHSFHPTLLPLFCNSQDLFCLNKWASPVWGWASPCSRASQAE